MSSRYWVHALAIVGLALSVLLVWWLVERQEERERAYDAARQEYEDSKGVLPPGVMPEGKRSIPDPQSYRDEWRSERDLQAQREMAKWAFFMLLAAGASVIVTGIGVVYVALTLHHTRRAADEGKRAADAAHIAAKAMMETDRAQISFKHIDIRIITVKDSEQKTIQVNYELENAGNTLGFMTEVLFSGYIGPSNALPGVPDYSRGRRQEMRDLIAPGHPLGKKILNDVERFPAESLERIQKRENDVIVFGFLCYTDIYKIKTHRYRFSFRFHFPRNKSPESTSVFYTCGSDAYWEYS